MLRDTVGGHPAEVSGLEPGSMVGDRYQLHGPLGRGAMGEVYRADDLKLGQPVALKFVPLAYGGDPARRERLFSEVRLARRVAHPNVCRVYDVAELAGRHCLTMEYVDGEDLASLLRRVGTVSAEKALELCRQLCAGLAAAHDLEVLHRDLKPANIMIDGRGRAKITDFGVAITAGHASTEPLAGTPAYMAPEQLRGHPASVRTDLYALGMVMYELWTGRMAFTGRDVEGQLEQKQAVPRAPSRLGVEIPAAVEEVILRCLEPDPGRRPASAAEVARALPGGDPLTAAVAAGDTPSPEMVAAGTAVRPLSTPAAVAMFTLFCVLAAVATGLVPDRLLTRIPGQVDADALRDRAASLLSTWGAGCAAGSPAWGFQVQRERLAGLTDAAADPAGAVLFWYRAGPRAVPSFGERVLLDDPPRGQPGECSVVLDAAGRLVELAVAPASPLPSTGPVVDLAPLLLAAGLEPDEVLSTPRLASGDFRLEPAGAAGATPLEVNATIAGGRVTRFSARPPGAAPLSGVPAQAVAAGPAHQASAGSPHWSAVAWVGLNLCLWVGGVVLVRRNWVRRQGDRQGSFRLAAAALVFGALGAWLAATHVTQPMQEYYLLLRATGVSLYWALAVWTMYMAVEPAVRRRWPRVLIGFTRVLAGRVVDPLVGRELLIGATLGAVVVCTYPLQFRLAELAGHPVPPRPQVVELLGSAVWPLGFAVGRLAVVIIRCLGTLVIVTITRLALRRSWLADPVTILVLAVVNVAVPDALWSTPAWVALPFTVVRVTVYTLVLVRGGLLHLMALDFVWLVLGLVPAVVAPGSPVLGQSLLTLAMVLAVPGFGLVASLSGRRPVPATTGTLTEAPGSAPTQRDRATSRS